MLLNQFLPSSSLQKITKISVQNRRIKRRKSNKTLNPKTHTILPYPRSSPNPPIIAPHNVPNSKHQAITRVLQELETSISKGVPIESTIYSSLLEVLFNSSSSFRHVTQLRSLIPPPLLRKSADLSSKLLRLYAFHGHIEEAHTLFDSMPQRNRLKNAFAWNSLISGYVELGCYEDAMALYYQMDEEGVEPDCYTFPRVLKACAGIGILQHGEAVHRDVVRLGFWNDLFVLNALVDMYAKCGDISKARRIFDSIVDRDCVSWNSMIVSYVRHGLIHEALDIFHEMVSSGNEVAEPDSVTMSALISNISSVNGNLGLQIHCWVLRRALEKNVSIANSLIGLYSDQKQLNKAMVIFESIEKKNLVSWNAIMSAHRRDPRVLVLFRQMEECGQEPDNVTFVCLLSACAKLRLVEPGKMLFNAMVEKYKIAPEIVHYGCMVDMLGRAGLIDEAYELIINNNMALDEGGTMWGALLHACLVHGNVEIGQVAADMLLELEPDNEHNVILLLKIYENAGRLDEIERVKKLMKERGFDMKIMYNG